MNGGRPAARRPARARVVTAHADAGERRGARFRGRAWRAAPTLTTMLDRLEKLSRRQDPVSVGRMLDAVGRSSFGPLLLIPGLIVLSPVGGMPGIPTTVALLVGLAALQIIGGRCAIWLPQLILRRCVQPRWLHHSVRFLRPLGRLSDAFCRSRLRWMTGDVGTRLIAALCLTICIAMPPLEVIPFANSACGAALALFGLSLTTRDGLVATLSLGLSLFAAWAVVEAIW
ncbi:Exopolysaccharide synthesis, ExoD [plant metagenome]|uniref:Exopolysaccharide synthesis, ExoD n=2 Tax=plant metagenome TaxID=1297885 RepID=A0A484Q4P3_9ZZZZ